ncbi:hypothetical protein [Pannonibacter tanglangensis]|uniref:Uncharacterized protein n=1 Tax=Pannonibacter tanglangensis TaxID=2750084 RepID=A0ABW9ZIQ1_9HYPH|nr:hypothetical protein [Pannonibacter sp. XCT-34]NBN64750.1 hypothetical protein [Pannonibacter sp. XCT-34]
MKKRAALIPQADATRLFRAARAAGYGSARITVRPDGTIEVEASETPAERPTQDNNSWDEVLR